ncbi:unnamed protein product [Spodoptera littoralis]|uniref:PHD-type domain-containing protein n=1 Tax=Spodoptera littoralis TaxID=7109 RepID=A0A9P0NA75_SPOLI|nr:unnamed protein product [Spodoptera littoralis]CAH1647053.1 unnamed protein product [Spodoptera littoralis]
MPPTFGICAGCNKSIKTKEWLKCGVCARKHDLECANIPHMKFCQMDNDSKAAWRCPECRCKQPKSDNTNTPIRAAGNSLAVSLDSSDVCNVTLRRPANSTPGERNTSSDFITEDKLRTILKHEIRVAVKTTIEGIISDRLKTIDEQMSGFQEPVSFF